MPRQATEAEQKSYVQLVRLVLRQVYTEQVASNLKKMAAQNPVDAVVFAAVTLLKTVSVAGKTAQKDVSKYLPSIAAEVVGHLVDMLVQFKVIQANGVQQVLQSANQEVQSIIGGK